MRILFCFALAFIVSSLRVVGAVPGDQAMSDAVRIAVTAADDERQAATLAADRARLDAIFADDLRYAHSSGKVDTKVAYIDSVVSRQTVYERFDSRERTFLEVAPGVVLMTGRVVVQVRIDGKPLELDLNFQAVWREEKGRWRFLAWQSSRNPPAQK